MKLLFGSKCRIEIVIICLLVGFIAGGYMLCGSTRPVISYNEGMTNNPLLGTMTIILLAVLNIVG